MSRRRNVKRTLPPLEVISFTHSSSAPSKRKIKFTTSTVGGACEIRDSENLDITTDPSQNFLPFSYELDDVNESDDGNDGDDEQEQITVCVSSYARKQERAAKHWSDIRGKLLQAVIESECIPDKQICMHCNQDSAAFRCLKCGAGIFYCEECVRSVHDHRNIFHVVEEWKDGMFQPSTIVGTILNPRPWHSCPTAEIKTITAISECGIRHQLGIATCKCEPFAVSLARLRMWPTSSKQPTYALSFDLLDWMETMLLECQVSLNDFCKALNNKLPKYVIRKNIYPLIIDCFEEYRHLKHELRTLQTICPENDYGNICPACPVNDGVLIESFDALFGLPRKKSAGSSVRQPLHGDNIFYTQEHVDKFVQSYHSTVAKPQSLSKDCNDFKAGDVLRTRTQYKALDETAVFGRACRHGFPKKFLNLKHGERIGYAVWVIQNIINSNEGKDIQIKLMYDIACILAKHLQASGQTSLLDNITLAVPAFHIYGHRGFCQLQYSPRRVAGFGLTDGEQLERLWSYLRRFGRMTKEMRPSHRIDVLSDAILHYARNCKDTLVSRLIKNWTKASQCMSASTESISQLTEKSPVQLTEPVIDKLAEMERQSVCGDEIGAETIITHNETNTNTNWISEYMEKLRIYYSLRNNLCAEGSLEPDNIPEVVKKIGRLDKELAFIEKHNKVSARWTTKDERYQLELQVQVVSKCQELVGKMKPVCQERFFLLKLKEKYSDGHALSKKLCKQVKNCEKKLKEILLEYNSSRDMLTDVNKRTFRDLDMKDVKNDGIEGIFHPNDDDDSDTNLCIPHSIRRHAIDMLHLLRRSKEEKQMIEEEMRRVFLYHKTEEKNVSDCINELLISDNNDYFTSGSISLLKSEQKILQHRLLSMHALLKSYVDLPDVNFPVFLTSGEEVNEDNDDSAESQFEGYTTTDDSSYEELHENIQ